MDVNDVRNAYGKARISDRQISELVGLAHGMIADGKVNKAEAEYFYKWLIANQNVADNPVISELYFRVEDFFADDHFSDEESLELFETLNALAGGDYEIGELQKSTSLPICDPAPKLTFVGSRFCFTGTFNFGKRKVCEAKVANLGGTAGSLVAATNYLVIGSYATDSWAHSSFGRKIEKAVDMRERGLPINIVTEDHWKNQIERLTP